LISVWLQGLMKPPNEVRNTEKAVCVEEKGNDVCVYTLFENSKKRRNDRRRKHSVRTEKERKIIQKILSECYLFYFIIHRAESATREMLKTSEPQRCI
jgi:hypothetical protein